MKHVAIAVCAVVVALTALPRAEQADLKAAVSKCQVIVDNTARLACFDAIGSANPVRSATPVATTPSSSGCVPSADRLRALALELRGKHADEMDFYRALDAAVGYSDGDPMPSTTSLPTPDGLFVAVATPYQTFRFALREAIRKREPIESVPVPAGVLIVVSSSSLDAPDVEKIILERDGTEI